MSVWSQIRALSGLKSLCDVLFGDDTKSTVVMASRNAADPKSPKNENLRGRCTNRSLCNDNKISLQSNLHFQNLIVVAFPMKKKLCFWTISLFAPNAPPT